MADGKKRVTSAPAGETPTQKLARLANKRVNKAITQIRLIGNLGAYGPTQQQKDVIVRAIESEVAAMKNNINVTKPGAVEAFKLV